MKQDIFQFWSDFPDGANIHPADEKVLQCVPHHFDLNCIANAFLGPLQTAPVVLLFLSPGLDDGDPAHCSTTDGRNYYAKMRTGKCDLPSKDEHPSAHKWLGRILRQFDLSYEQSKSAIATLNVGAYKSKDFKDGHMLSALPSSRVCLDWAQSVLFPQAEARERIVVCLRSRKYWGLGTSSIGTLFCPQHNRNAIMLKKGDMRESIVKEVHNAVRGKTQ